MKEHVAMCLWRGVGGGALLSPKKKLFSIFQNMHKPKKRKSSIFRRNGNFDYAKGISKNFKVTKMSGVGTPRSEMQKEKIN